MESHYIKIYTGSFIIIQLLTEKLEAIGITPIIKDEMESARLAGFGSSATFQQELYVHENEADKSIPIIQAALAEIES